MIELPCMRPVAQKGCSEWACSDAMIELPCVRSVAQAEGVQWMGMEPALA